MDYMDDGGVSNQALLLTLATMLRMAHVVALGTVERGLEKEPQLKAAWDTVLSRMKPGPPKTEQTNLSDMRKGDEFLTGRSVCRLVRDQNSNRLRILDVQADAVRDAPLDDITVHKIIK